MTRRILLADDSVTIQKVIELTFMDEDYEVTAVSNGDEAVNRLGEVRPDFVIADVHMPGANGYEVCRRAKAQLPGVPVLLLVGTFEPFDEAQSGAAGADAFLKKPFDSQELLHLVGQLLGVAPAAAAAAPPAAEAPSPGGEVVAFPSGTGAAPAEAEAPSGLAGFGSTDLGSPGLGAQEAEPAWSSFDLEAEPAPAAGWQESAAPSYAPEEEPVFELEDSSDVLALDDSLLEEAPPLAESPTEAFAEGIVLDDEHERAGWREARAAAPAVGAGFGAGPGAGATGMEATPEERLGVPLGAAPLASGLDEVQHAVAEHTPAFATAAPAASHGPAAAASSPSTDAGARHGDERLSDEDVERIARRVAELVGERVLRDVAWEVVPDMAELVIKDRLRELESQVD